MASVAALLGRDDELGRYMDRSKWFLATRLAVSDDFNRSLAREILADRYARPMKEGALYGAGARVDHLQQSSNPHTKELLDRIRAAIDSYVAEREFFSDDPMMAQRPAAVSIKSGRWRCTHGTLVVRPSGWMVSGVTRGPELAAGAGHPGAIELARVARPHPDALAAHRWRAADARTGGVSVALRASNTADRRRP
jgi:hypothetical protein